MFLPWLKTFPLQDLPSKHKRNSWSSEALFVWISQTPNSHATTQLSPSTFGTPHKTQVSLALLLILRCQRRGQYPYVLYRACGACLCSYLILNTLDFFVASTTTSTNRPHQPHKSSLQHSNPSFFFSQVPCHQHHSSCQHFPAFPNLAL